MVRYTLTFFSRTAKRLNRTQKSDLSELKANKHKQDIYKKHKNKTELIEIEGILKVL